MKYNADRNRPISSAVLKNKKLMVNPENPTNAELAASLYPGEFLGGCASATECTGLMQNVALTPEVMNAYDEVFSYRKTEKEE